jgi:hypothetical protein
MKNLLLLSILLRSAFESEKFPSRQMSVGAKRKSFLNRHIILYVLRRGIKFYAEKIKFMSWMLQVGILLLKSIVIFQQLSAPQFWHKIDLDFCIVKLVMNMSIICFILFYSLSLSPSIFFHLSIIELAN